MPFIFFIDDSVALSGNFIFFESVVVVVATVVDELTGFFLCVLFLFLKNYQKNCVLIEIDDGLNNNFCR